jgi:hypothetical protein
VRGRAADDGRPRGSRNGGEEMLTDKLPGRQASTERWEPGAACPRCRRRHQTWHTLARCRWSRGLLWVLGDPPAEGPCYATVSRCHEGGIGGGPMVTVCLWAARDEAEGALACIDRLGCGGRCSRRHSLHVLRESRVGA